MGRAVEPELQRRRLLLEIRRLREAAGLTQQEVAAKLEWSPSKVLRIEGGDNSPSITDLRAMLDAYGVRDSETADRIVALARLARRPSWTHRYREAFPPPFTRYLNLERSALTIRAFELSAVPGMLQTADYAAATIALYGDRKTSSHVLNQRVEVRIGRQELLESEDPLDLRFVLDETVVRRRIGRQTGSPGLMARQLEHLRECARHPAVTIQVLPFDQGEHPGMSVGAFTILEFDEPGEEPMLFLESAAGDTVRAGDPDLVPTYLETFDQLQGQALDPRATSAFIEEMIEQVRRN